MKFAIALLLTVSSCFSQPYASYNGVATAHYSFLRHQLLHAGLQGVLGDPSLVAYWTFGEGGGRTALDSSGLGSNGAWNGTATGTGGTYYTTGEVGAYAGKFDGSTTYVAASATTIVSELSTNNVTFCSWFDPSGLTTAEMGLMGVGSSNGSENGLNAAFNNKHYYFWSSNGTTFASTATINNGQWYFLCGTAAGSAYSLYVNGSLDSSFTGYSSPGTITPVSSSFILGNEGQNNSARLFNGSIGNSRVYNRALSAAEIATIYKAGQF